ncbi:hypothetical protein L0128_12525 [candidate division KSB1 bacterium]|nr:hypothetical protein [candidate division KSB1 bacterium]
MILKILMFGFCLLLTPLMAADSSKTIAVLDFTNNSLLNKAEFESLSKGLAEMLISELSQVPALEVVERQKLNALLAEMQLAQTGLISETSTAKIGQLLGAQYLVLGSFMAVPGNKIRIDARSVHVETGKTLLAEKSEGNTKDILKLINKLSTKILERLQVKFASSMLASARATSPEAIQAFSLGLNYEDLGNKAQALKMYQQALKLDKNLQVAQKRLDSLSKN